MNLNFQIMKMFQQLFKNLRIIRKNCFPAPFWADMVMKEDSSGVGVPGHQIRVNLDKSEGHRTERLKVFKKNKFCSYFNKF